MPWARIPPDKLVNLPLFGIDVIADDGDFVWMRGPSGRMRVNKLFPRVWFETVEDAHQAGAAAIRITNDADLAEHEAIMAAFTAEQAEPAEGGGSGETSEA